ncbi:TonB-dependent receptor [Alteromonas sp. ASW11-36]|uniref:TonB-dependent receptor n=1 Tax=Alteromonas arenosi TaxID=3055817 RepID=A0ABT7SW71_9ALTE|nr:TonB-dependent receptor [Alteromonas sp. ASW11-36]MDM7860440.1 TonB-dependent receptor [Alteromonas sp. ASW11-36]
MMRKTKLALLLSAAFAMQANAQSLEGTVVNEKGEPIPNTHIVLEGSNIEVKTDESGKFTFDRLSIGLNELHFKAQGYSHLHTHVELDNTDRESLTFVLKRSPIEIIDVTAVPIHLSAMESALPVSVIGGEELDRQQAATLGDTLESLPGVHSNFHAKVASTPVIRGLSGPRVLIAQNGLDVSDVSRVGPDHAVASEASTAQQIEVFRGPATLLYGSGAIGGVVNVVDQSVPKTNETQGEWLVQTGTVDDEKLGAFNFTTGTDSLAFYFDGYYRDSEDYEIPGEAELHDEDHEDEHDHEGEHGGDGIVENSAEESSGFTFGTSYLMDNGYIGLSIEQFNREYGIPGHSHGEEEHGHEDEHDEEHEEGVHEHGEEVYADLEQTRVQIQGQFDFADGFFRQVNVRAGYTDYEHAEIEEGEIGTVFQNETVEFRLDGFHRSINDFKGGLSLHYKNSDFVAEGEEAFTPPSETEMLALALLEERHFGDFLFQFGARIEHVNITADAVPLPELESHGHDEHDADDHDEAHEHEGEHEGEHHDESQLFSYDESFTPISLSAGVVWDYQPGYNVGFALSRSERAPSSAELLSFGPHIGTGTYEIGALFVPEEHDGETEFEFNADFGELETSTNIDLTWRKTEGDVGFIFNLYYNQIDNYYYQLDTGLYAEDGHDHEEEHGHEEDMHDDEMHEDEHEHEGELPVLRFARDDVILNGFEAQVSWQMNDEFILSGFADYVRARLKDGGDLPRTSPMRFGTSLSYQTSDLTANLDITRYQSQDRIAEFETATDGYTLVDLDVAYTLPVMNQSMEVYFKGENLGDTEARVHTSFLKDLAPRPGRNLVLGIRGTF